MKIISLCKCMIPLVVILFLFSQSSLAQPLTTKPYMWVERNEGQGLINNFNRGKSEIIDRHLNMPQQTSFSFGNFFGFLAYLKANYPVSYLRVHFAVCTQQEVPSGWDGRVILVFSPVDASNKDLDYFILAKKFNASTPNQFKITKQIKDIWVARYNSIPLVNTIDPGNSDNQYDDPSKPGVKIPSDTRYVTYCFSDFEEIARVRQLYRLNSSVNAFLSAYSAQGAPHPPVQGRFKNRSTILFGLVDPNGNPFYLESIPDFSNLPQGSSNCLPLLNNGQLCPVNCGQ